MIKDKEAFQRLSFLYQAAHCVLAHNPENQELARFYCHTQNSISRRLVLRQDPSVKRTICKSCFSLLVPGVSSTVRQRSQTPGSVQQPHKSLQVEKATASCAELHSHPASKETTVETISKGKMDPSEK
ncbi:hypothetical protein JD844_013387 [Phrynosoma platyrhinos]|uniref:Uncharacterized protein n=1 Tax=Phrynosoma platyrhinos TaxID=52577 RepID=A0ABQ7TLJ5_PHRPL|nr:hypothetical protein JD844_013387 [Phrynosoma platyrhinos]